MKLSGALLAGIPVRATLATLPGHALVTRTRLSFPSVHASSPPSAQFSSIFFPAHNTVPRSLVSLSWSARTLLCFWSHLWPCPSLPPSSPYLPSPGPRPNVAHISGLNAPRVPSSLGGSDGLSVAKVIESVGDRGLANTVMIFGESGLLLMNRCAGSKVSFDIPRTTSYIHVQTPLYCIGVCLPVGIVIPCCLLEPFTLATVIRLLYSTVLSHDLLKYIGIRMYSRT